MTATARTLSLFEDDAIDAPTTPRPKALRPAPTPRRLVEAAQVSLPIRTHLPVIQPDYHAATGSLCLVQQDECEATECRYHLGEIRTHDGHTYGCALAVAADHTTLPPVFVARLLGITEGKAQEAEHRAMRWCLREWQRLDDEEDAITRRRLMR